MVRKYCGWHIAPVIEETLTLDGPGSSALLLPSGRVVEVLRVTEDGEAIDPATLGVSAAGVLRKPRGSRWTDELGGVTVTLSHGHEQHDDLAALVSQIAARAAITGSGALSETAGPFAIRRGTSGGGGEVAGIPLLHLEKQLLAPYRLNWGL